MISTMTSSGAIIRTYEFTAYDNKKPYKALIFGGPGPRNGVKGGEEFLASVERLEKNFADVQVAVTKAENSGRTVAEARRLDGEDRVIELSRMLSGQPGSATARDHAEELLAVAQGQRAAR